MVRNCNQYHSKTTNFRISPPVNLKAGIDFAMLFTLRTTRKGGELQILRCQGIAVGNYSLTLDVLILWPSGFCNVGVISRTTKKLYNKCSSTSSSEVALHLQPQYNQVR